jgi:hypothetical protein
VDADQDIYRLYTGSDYTGTDGAPRAFVPEVLDGFLERIGDLGQADGHVQIRIQGSPDPGLDQQTGCRAALSGPPPIISRGPREGVRASASTCTGRSLRRALAARDGAARAEVGSKTAP